MRANSLAFRLVAGAAVWSLAALVVGGLALSMLFRDYVERSFDARLTVLLESLVAASEVDADGRIQLTWSPGEPRFQKPYSGWYWQIAGSAGPEVRSRSLWDQELPMSATGDGSMRRRSAVGPAAQDLRMVARDIRLPGRDGALAFAVAADRGEINTEIRRFNGALIWSLGLLGLGLVAAMVIQVHYGLRPLHRLGRALANIRAGRADRLLGRYPAEIMPLAEELDLLLDQNRAVVERARTQVGNLAHALKTPLSVLTNEAAAGPAPLGPVVRRQVALMRRHVDHYLARARTAATGRVLGARTDVAAVAADLGRTLRRIHADRGLAIETDLPAGAEFRGERQDLEEMLGNLLDNACKWARRRVRLTARRSGDRLRFTIDDDGPGLAPDLRVQVLERGARLDETKPGSGLGLAIVRDMAGLYGGTIELETAPEGGLRAILDLPAASKQIGDSV